MEEGLLKFVGNIIAQAPLLAVALYLWYMDRKDKLSEIEHLRRENKEKTEIVERFVKSMDKLALSLELIKDRLR